MRGDTQLTAESRGYMCVCASVRTQTRMHGECVSGLHRVHSVYGESVAATWLHNGISQYSYSANTHTHKYTDLTPNKQVSGNKAEPVSYLSGEREAAAERQLS